MKRENNKKFKKRKRNQNRSLTCRVLSMMFAIVLFCSTVLINTDYVSQASSFDDMVDMVEVEEDSAAVDISEETGDDLGTDVNFESEESTDETYSESDDFGSSDADFSSGENMFTDGTSESSAPVEEAAQPVSCIVNLKNETIEIKAEAPAGVLPNGTQMIVKAVENNTEDAELTDQYNKLAAKITEQLQSQGKNLDGFLAYNVSFTDADGNPVEPSDKVTYSFTYKEASSPELTDPAASTVTAAMIRTNKETSELELTELKAEADKLTVETNESRQLTKAAFQSAATAAYTFVWSSTPAADDNENTENKEENGEVNNEEVNADTNTENTEEETNTENNVENSEEEQNPEEAPDQEQIKMIRITADEVNLRVAPSTEADVIATVDTDTQLPLLETVTDEDEFTWYKVSYEETKAYVRSDMAEVVETEEQEIVEEESEEEIPEEVQIEDTEGILTFTKIVNDLVEVIATTEVGVIPEDAELIVNPIEQGTDQYAETENKLNEKAEEDGYEIAGFLAYDIYFQDSEGIKIEPVDGSVNVSMHYIEPSVPEEVAQAAENGSEAAVFAEEDEFSQNETTATQMDITMMHLVEDENGNVNVVDMTQEGTASVETDAAGSVQKAEFETTSFSTFTITWSGKKSGSLIINVIDTNGNTIGTDQKTELESGKEYTVNNVVEKIGDIEEYSFYKAKVSSSPKAEGTVVKRIKFSDKKNQYNSADSNGKWENIGENNVYFIYAKNPTRIPTIDHTDAGITMKMTNLVNGNNFSIGTDKEHLIDFGSNSGYGNGTIKKGLLNNKLSEDGYPTTKNNNESIESLFSGKTVNNLFSSDYYNATGYYEYSSFKNYAYLGNASNFKVYDAIGTPSDQSINTNGKVAYFYKRGNFMPYNDIVKGKFSTNTNQYDENGNELEDTDPAKGKELYLSQGTDYYFSMYMGANFIQPKDGNATHNGSKSPMIYEFNGDDDMWVYIDNVLVLDIGGVHDAHSGKIDFSTGDVSWTDCVLNGTPGTTSTTLKGIFRNAGIFPDGKPWDDKMVGEYFNNDTFKDYTTHSFKMFYMERGAGASNLHMKFNIQVIPEGQVEVRKELSNTDKEKYSNVKFAFQVYAQDILSTDANGNETYKDEYVLLNTKAKNKDTGADIVFLNNQDINGESYNSVFYLKPDESAVFTGLKANRKYYVKEIGVKSEEYDEVKINNTSYIAFNENNEQTGEIKDISTDKKQVSQRPLVVYTNNCSAANSRELQITKKMKDNKVVVDTFSFKIQLSNSIGELVPYVNGDYYLKDADGNYYYNEEGNLTSNGKTAKVCGKTDNDGIVKGVPVDYTVVVTQLLSGTNFKVEEVDLTSNYKTPVKEVDYESCKVVTGADGEIELKKDAKVTITNEIKKLDEPEAPFIEVTKTFVGLTKDQVKELASADPPYQITVTNGNDTRILKMEANDTEFNKNLTGEGTTWTYTWKLQNCSTGTYKVEEANYNKDGYQVTPTINGANGDNADVETKQATITYTSTKRETQCADTQYNVGNINLIVAKLTQSEGYFVWTRQPASVNARMAIVNLINTKQNNNGIGFSPEATLMNSYFFSGVDKIKSTLVFRGKKIYYDGSQYMNFDDPKQWTMFATGNYTITDGHDAEVRFTNTYEEITADLDLVKVSKNDSNSKLDGAEFQLYKKENGTYKKVYNNPITVKNGNTDIELKGLKPGEYYLEETKAPVGYMLLGDKIYFKQEAGEIKLTTEGGELLSEGNVEFWSLSTTNGKNVLTIQNQILYSLPSTGGNGIYWYMISGMVLMSTAAWILYKNKCKEVLGK